MFGGVRSRDSDNPESSPMTTCKSEFFHDEMKRSIIGLTLIKYVLVFIHALARTIIDWVYPCYLKTKRPYIYCVCRLSTSFNRFFFFFLPNHTVSRWIYLDDQNLCVQTSSSFVYGAVPIGVSIYVVGDLDTGELKAVPIECKYYDMLCNGLLKHITTTWQVFANTSYCMCVLCVYIL